jgi:hypothetical protein
VYACKRERERERKRERGRERGNIVKILSSCYGITMEN